MDTSQPQLEPQQEEEELQAEAADADEPVSDIAADPESDPEADLEAEAEAESEAEQDAEAAQRRTAARKKSFGSYRGPGPRRLKAEMPELMNMLKDMAFEPEAFEWDGRGAEGAAFLSFRELV